MRNLYIVCYDVMDSKRLSQTYKTMKGYGDHVQYSVFSCRLSLKELIYMREDLGDILNFEEDRVMIMDIGPTGINTDKRITTIGIPLESKMEESSIVI